MKALIHIGTEKTGTTTIQQMLKENSELLERGSTGYYSGEQLRNSRELAVYCMRDDKSDDFTRGLFESGRRDRKSWRKACKAHLQGTIESQGEHIRQVIFSSEHFHSSLTTHQEVERLRELLLPWFDEFEIVVYLRRQDRVATSLYSTMCRNGGRREQVIKKATDAHDPYYDYLGMLQRWGKVFEGATLTVRLFDRSELLQGDVCVDFLEVAGLDHDAGFERPERLNEKLSAPVQRALVAANNGLRGERWQPLRAELVRQLASESPGPESLPTQSEAESFYGLYRDANRELARRYLGRDALFDEDFSDYPEQADSATVPLELASKVLAASAAFLADSGHAGPKPVDAVQERGAVLRDLGLLYRDSHPQLALELLQQARIYRPQGPVILRAIEALGGSLDQAPPDLPDLA